MIKFIQLEPITANPKANIKKGERSQEPSKNVDVTFQKGMFTKATLSKKVLVSHKKNDSKSTHSIHFHWEVWQVSNIADVGKKPQWK